MANIKLSEHEVKEAINLWVKKNMPEHSVDGYVFYDDDVSDGEVCKTLTFDVDIMKEEKIEAEN